MLEVEFRPRAQLDLESVYIHAAVAQASPATADAIIGRLYASIEQLAEFPDLGSAFNDASVNGSYRRMLSGSHWIYYTHDEKTLTVWRVFHTRQDIDDYSYVDL